MKTAKVGEAISSSLALNYLLHVIYGRYSLVKVVRDGRIIFENTVLCHIPLRHKYNNQLQDGLPFHVLIRAALRRTSSLETAYGKGEPDLDYRGLGAEVARVQQKVADCRWTDIQHYGSRQKTAMQLCGIN